MQTIETSLQPETTAEINNVIEIIESFISQHKRDFEKLSTDHSVIGKINTLLSEAKEHKKNLLNGVSSPSGYNTGEFLRKADEIFRTFDSNPKI